MHKVNGYHLYPMIPTECHTHRQIRHMSSKLQQSLRFAVIFISRTLRTHWKRGNVSILKSKLSHHPTWTSRNLKIASLIASMPRCSTWLGLQKTSLAGKRTGLKTGLGSLKMDREMQSVGVYWLLGSLASERNLKCLKLGPWQSMQEVFFVINNKAVFTLHIQARSDFLFPSAFQDPAGIRMFILGQ